MKPNFLEISGENSCSKNSFAAVLANVTRLLSERAWKSTYLGKPYKQHYSGSTRRYNDWSLNTEKCMSSTLLNNTVSLVRSITKLFSINS